MITADIDNTTTVRVRYADTDQMGIAYNGVYFTWFEVGRTELFRNARYTYHDIEAMGIRLPLLEAGVKYLKPAFYDNVLIIRTIVENQKGARIRFGYEILRGDELLVTGFTEHVFTDNNLRPVRPPKELADLDGLL